MTKKLDDPSKSTVSKSLCLANVYSQKQYLLLGPIVALVPWDRASSAHPANRVHGEQGSSFGSQTHQ